MTHKNPEWKVSLHGGHSGEFSEHAEGTLREVLESAVRFGYHTFGVSEHAPRLESKYLYPKEIKKGITIETLQENFRNYAKAIKTLQREFADKIVVLRGFETEVVPPGNYDKIMKSYREEFEFDYIVGSVHYSGDTLLDSSPEDYQRCIDTNGSLEKLAISYYESLAGMVPKLKPEVVGHFDLVRKNAKNFGPVDTPKIRKVAEDALNVVKEHGSILDLNTAGYRKGLGAPYPAPWVVQLAKKIGIGFCFGDDSHSPNDVGAGIDDARLYLIENGIHEVTVLTRSSGGIVKKTVQLS